MSGPTDPLQKLHAEMLNRDLLEGPNRDFNNFSKALADPARRKDLYSILEDEGWGVHGYDDFENTFFSKPEPVKKKEDTGAGSSGSGSSPAPTPALVAETPSNTGEIPASAPNQLLKQYGNQAGPQIAAGSSRLDVPDLLTGEENPFDVGSNIRRNTEADYEFKEKRSYGNPKMRASRQFEDLSMYSQAASKQVAEAESNIQTRFGKDWQTEFAKAIQAVNSKPENPADIEYYNDAQAFVKSITADPDFNIWRSGQDALVKAKSEYDNYTKNNPEYAQYNAMEMARKTMAANPSTGIANWAMGKGVKVAAGIAALPRTILGVAAQDARQGAALKNSGVYKWAQDMGDFADKTIGEAASFLPTGEANNRPLWEKTTSFEGVDVVVDDNGRPVRTMKNGKDFQADPEFEQRFLASGASQNAKTTFTGMQNAGFKLADVVTDMYLMRSLGGGTKAGTTAVAFGLAHQDAYNTAINDLKLTGDDASAYAMVSAGLSGLIESTIGDIETKPLKMAAAKALGISEAKALVGKAGPYEIAKAAWRPYLESIAGENVEELVDNMAQTTNNQVFNAWRGSSLDTNISPEQTAETIVMTTLATTLAGGGDAMREGYGQLYSNALNAAVQNPDAFSKVVNDLVQGGVIDAAQAEAQQARIQRLSEINAALPAGITEENRNKAIALEDQRLQIAAMPAASAAQVKAKADQDKAVENEIIKTITEPSSSQDAAQQENADVATQPTATDTEQAPVAEPAEDIQVAEPVQPIPEADDAAQTQDSDALIQVFNGQYDDNPFESLPTQDYIGEDRLVSVEDRRSAGVPDLSEVVSNRNIPVSEVVSAYGDDAGIDALVDDGVNVALSAMMPQQRRQVVGNPGLLAALQNQVQRAVTAPAWLDENGGDPFIPVMEAMGQDFADARLTETKETRLTKRFSPVSVMDHIAAAFAGGVRVRPTDVAGNVADAKSGSIQLQFTSRNGTPIDLIAQDILESMGSNQEAAVDMTENDVISQIYEFIDQNPNGPGNYMRDAIAAREMSEMEPVDNDGTAERPVEEIDARDAVDVESDLNDADAAELEAFIDSYNGDMAQLVEDLDNYDPFEETPANVAIRNLSPTVLNAINDKLSTIQDESGPQTGENVLQSQGEIREQPEAEPGDGGTETRNEGRTEQDVRAEHEELTGLSGPAIMPVPVLTVNESGGVVTNAEAFADLLSQAGAQYDASAGGWSFTAEQSDAVKAALSERRTDGRPVIAAVHEAAADSGVGGSVLTILTQPGAVLHRYQTRKKLAAARSLKDRLAIAKAMHQIDRARDQRAVRRMIKRLQEAFPNIDIETDAVVIDRVKKARGITGNPMGFQIDGKVYVDMRYARPDTPIHEFGHIWSVKTKADNPALWKRAEALAKDSDLYEAVKNNPAYAGLSEEQVLDEVVATAIGERGLLLGNSAVVIRFRRWLSDMWSSLQRAFGFNPQFMTLKEFADYHAMTMLGEKPVMTETSRRIKQLERQAEMVRSTAEMADRMNVAVAMEKRGEDAAKIFVTTGWVRSSDGFWRWGVDSDTFAIKIDPESNFDVETATVSEVVDWPELYEQYPELAAMPVSGFNADPYSPAIVFDIQNSLMSGIEPDTQASDLHQMAAEEATVLAGAPAPAPKLQVGSAAAEYAARVASARDIIALEIQREGLKDVDEKAVMIAEDLNLDLNHVKRIFEQEAARASAGRLVLTKATLNGDVPAFRERLMMKAAARVKRSGKWLQRKFRTGGLLPRDIFWVDQKRLGRIASRIKDGQYLLADLEEAMKNEYGKPNEAQWRLVDNVMRGEGDWSLLPAQVYAAAKALRQYTDMLSRELVRSGVMKGDVIVTVLENSGIEDAEAKLVDWDGVNLQEALAKLPFERTDTEHAAIEDFLNSNNGTVGNYLYRSYRKYDDTNWRETVEIENPRVWAEAKSFLEAQVQAQINALLQTRIDKAEDLKRRYDETSAEIDAILDGIDQDIAALEQKQADIEVKQLEFAQARGGSNKSLDKQYAATVKAVRELQKRAKQARAVVDAEDAQILAQIEDEDFQHLSVSAKRVVKKRRQMMELQERIAAAATMNQDVLDEYQHRLQNVEGLMEEILDLETGPVSQLSRSKLGAKDMNILKARKDIAEPIRELMGEYHDPRVNFAKSMYRMVNLLENQKFLTDLRENFKGVYFIPANEVRKGFVEISSEGSATMAPLNGWKAPIEVRDALNAYFAPSEKARNGWERVFNKYVAVASAVKYGKTILSPVTHFRNFAGNVFFMINNAYSPLNAKQALAFKDAWTNMKNIDDRKYVSRLTELRVLANGSYIGSIKELLNSMNADSVDQFFEGMGTGSNRLRKGIENTYGAEDDFYRIMAFETEKARYATAWYGQPFAALTPAQQNAVEEHAAGLVINLLPTYSMIPEIAKDIQKFPLTGTFVAFPAEMFRVTWNQWKQIGNDLNDPRTRGIGMQRLLGAAVAQIGLTVGMTALGHWLSGIDWDEDKALRRFLFPWQDNGVLVFTDFEPGKEARFVNMSYTNPYSFQTKPVMAMFANFGKDWKSRAKEAMWNVVEPFFAPELTAQTIGQLYYNINELTNRPVYNPGLGPFGDWENTQSFLLWNLQPGASKFGLDLISSLTGWQINNRTPKETTDVLMGLFGLQVERVNFEKAFTSKLVGHRKEKQYGRDVFIDSKFNYKNDPEGLKRRFELATQEYNDALRSLGISIDAANMIGMNPATLNAMMKEKDFSEAERAAAVTGSKIIPKFEGYNK